MISKKELLKGSRLYAIVDKDSSGNKSLKLVKAAVLGGADILQLRDKSSPSNEILKTAKVVKKITDRYGIPLIVNDRLDVALEVDARGLHIGQGDIDISLAKKFLGKGKLIGISVKNVREALKAKRDGADYLGVGPVFKTPIKGEVKPRGFKLLCGIKKLNIPFFAIGGINYKNIFKLAKKGFTNVAVIRAISEAKDPYKAVRRLKEAIQ